MIRKPPPLGPSSKVGIIAPASAPVDPNTLAAGLMALESRGLSVVRNRMDLTSRGYLAGDDRARSDELNAFLREPEIGALIGVRGGYGSLRILDNIDYEEARKHPKLLVGYSDITALHFAFYTLSGWTGISGPMVAVEWPNHDPASEKLFWEMASGSAVGSILGPSGEHLRPIATGRHEGILLGGNLSIIVRMLGSRYMPSLDGAILYLEEIGEPPYRIDAMFAQLKLSGVLDALGGLVLGSFTESDPPEGKPSLTLEQVVSDYFSDARFPVADGLIYGHIPIKCSMPFGIRARLEVDKVSATLSMLESVTEAT